MFLDKAPGRCNDQRAGDWQSAVTLLLLLLVFTLLGAWTINDTPALSFDEGWRLTVAKNWAQTGKYTQYLLDKPVPAKMLNTGFPAIAPIALSFRVLGIGIWQGRLPSLLFTGASLLLLYFIASRLFGARVAGRTVLALFLLPGMLHPVIWGKQAIGEPAGIFFLLAGFAVLLGRAGRSRLFPLLSGILLGLACITKAQFLPFVALALAGPLVLAASRRLWADTRLLAFWSGSTALSFLALFYVQRLLVGQEALTEPGLYSSTAFVTIPSIRILALLGVLVQALPTLLALVFACRARSFGISTWTAVTRFALLAFSISWLAWYLLCSVAWARYMYPCVLAASPFVGYFLDSMIEKARQRLAQHRVRAGAITVILLAGLAIWSGSFTATALLKNFSVRNPSLISLAGFLNGLKDGRVIESFDMEVFFMLNTRNYHHPPDRVQLLLNRRSFLGEQVTIDYDPLVADPEYLVIGPASRGWGVYNDVLDSAHFIPLGRAGNYEVYRRVRLAKPQARPPAS